MQCEIVVREATPRDMEARAELVRQAVTEYDLEAFLLFFFQELTLQVCVLCGAVLFIFVGAGLWACAAVLPGAAAAVALCVAAAHRALADKHVQQLRGETRGFVAEYRGPLVAEPRTLRTPVVLRPSAGDAVHTRVVGTVSVSECWGPRQAGWLHALCVAPAWRRRGAGAALLAAAREYAAAEGLEALEAVASELQGAARCLLHAAGWEMRGSYARPLLGAALTLHVTQLGVELPHA
ncbi:hypothetical protein PYW07_010318 [Mythimna separata]|uniref:N-acetyltransferase domain-containing protein n=1 Tax=Mythimna separata TaxID=271217 RepID=A0AAD7YIT9_MYTSE|nr:hypothetical protein PYW07_010318 [Mythimna separata]